MATNPALCPRPSLCEPRFTCSSLLFSRLHCSYARKMPKSTVMKAHIPITHCTVLSVRAVRTIQCSLVQQGSLSYALSGNMSSASSFMGGSYCLRALCLPPLTSLRRVKRVSPRAASDDVPSYKGFPPMTEKPKWWWRVIACIPYLMPLCETWMYAETAYSLHAFLEDYEFCTYPFLALLGKLPGWFLLAYFFAAYLGVVRNNRWPHFLRFHVVTGMLLEILVQVMGTVNDWIPQSVYWGKIGAHTWLAVAFAFLFTVIECIRCALRGMYADVPFISDAAYMQIPYE